MLRPSSTDLRERALLACERDGDACTAVARRFRVGLSTLRLWRKQAREAGRRAPLRMGRGPAPLGGKLAMPGQQDREDVAAARTAWRGEAAGTDLTRLVALDESGFDTRLVRTGSYRATPPA